MTISTHTLTWSVTCVCHLINKHSFNFNSHAHVERDTCHAGRGRVRRDFNSHAHVERDKTKSKTFPGIAHFNSHAHVERDFMYKNIAFFCYISTHTLTWSVTIPVPSEEEYIVISTHTLTWSVTHSAPNEHPKPTISTHTLTWSVTCEVRRC